MNAETKPVALITGAASGIGAHIAQYLATHGYDPVLHYHTDVAGIEKTFSVLKALAPKSTTFQADLTREENVHALTKHIAETYGRLDVVIHTVGDFLSQNLLDITPTDYHRIIDTNLTSSLLIAQAVVPIMRHNGVGKIIFFGASHARISIARKNTTLYTLTKYGVTALTEQLANDLALEHITVSCICPTVLEDAKYPLKTPTEVPVSNEGILRTIEFILQSEHSTVNGSVIELGDGWLPRGQ